MEQKKNNTEEHVTEQVPPELNGIVSVNSRSKSNNLIGKVVFAIVVFAIVLIGSLIGFNKHRAAKKMAYAAELQTSKNENKPAAVGPRRTFDTDPPPLPGAQPKAADGSGNQGASCADGSPSTVLLGQDGKPLLTPNGTAMHVCKDGRVLVPAVAGAQPIPVTGTQQGSSGSQTQQVSRYTGDVILNSPNSISGANRGQPSLNPNDPMTALAMSTLNNMNQGHLQQASFANSSDHVTPSGDSSNPQGGIGNFLKPSSTPMVTASKIGDRNMILPKGRTIDCALSMRLVNEVAGMASCVLSQNVYSDNGRVVLLERGSEATGEYASAMAQGQRRLFVLWTRIKTPEGVIINVNSPAADSLGTSGLDGYIDNHWWDRLGAAFMLSLVKDAISYATAASAGGGGGQSLGIFQSTSESGNRMAEKVLESTINIKPTLYRNQGSRGTIFVARDLDFGSVYALRAR